MSCGDEVVTGPLEGAAFFEACLAEPDRSARLDGVQGVLASTTTTCVEEQQDCSGF